MKKKTNTRYSLGRLHAACDMLSFSRDPLGCLQRTRAFRGSVIWTSVPPDMVVPSEEKADGIVSALKTQFPGRLVEEGLRPLSAVHGMAWYERYVVLELNEGEREAAASLIASRIGRTVEEVRSALEDISEDQLTRL